MNLMLETFDDLENKIIILGDDFNQFLDSVLESEGGSPVLKNLLFQNSLKLKKKTKTNYVTFLELEKQKKNVSYFDKTLAQVFYREYQIIFLF